MDILLVMCIGVLVGKFLIPGKAKTANEYLSLLCTFLLIFSMGVTLGSDDNFFEELSALGVTSFLFFLDPDCALHCTGVSADAAFYAEKRH